MTEVAFEGKVLCQTHSGWEPSYLVININGQLFQHATSNKKKLMKSYSIVGQQVVSYADQAYASDNRPHGSAIFGVTTENLGPQVFEVIGTKARYDWIEVLGNQGAEDAGLSKIRAELAPEKKVTLIMEGYLHKRFRHGAVIKVWRKFYFFITDSNTFGYYLNDKKRDKTFEVAIKGAKVQSYSQDVFSGESTRKGPLKGYFFSFIPSNYQNRNDILILEVDKDSNRYKWLEKLAQMGADDDGIKKVLPPELQEESVIPDDSKETKSDEVIKEGYLFKRFASNAAIHQWEKKYFVLTGAQFGYYPNDKTRTHLKTYPLTGSKISSFTQNVFQEEARSGYFFGITPVSVKETFVLEAENETIRYAWVEALQKGGAIDSGLSKTKPKCIQTSFSVPTHTSRGSCRGLIVKEGYLTKRFESGATVQNWERYYFFLLANGQFGYYEDSSKKGNPVKIILNKPRSISYTQEVFKDEGQNGFFFGIEPQLSANQVVLQADTETSRYEWLEGINDIAGAVSLGMSKKMPDNMETMNLKEDLSQVSEEEMKHWVKSGYLYKRFKPTAVIKQWKRYFFVITDDKRILYYPHDHDRKKYIAWNITDLTTQSYLQFLFKDEGRQGYFFGIANPSQKKSIWILECGTSKERYEWIELLGDNGAEDLGLSKTKPTVIEENKQTCTLPTTTADSITHEGYLCRRCPPDSGPQKWEKSYFIATGVHTLGYYPNDKNREELKSFPIEGSSIVSYTQKLFQEEARSGYFFGFTCPKTKEILILEAETLIERYEWIEHIQLHGAKDLGISKTKPIIKPKEIVPEQKKNQQTVQLIKEGWLWGKDVKMGWKKMYWVLSGDSANAYNDESKTELKRSFLIEGAKVTSFTREAYAEEKRPGSIFGVTVAGSEKTQLFESENTTERYRWVEMIQMLGAIDCGLSTKKAIHDRSKDDSDDSKTLKAGELLQRMATGKKWRQIELILDSNKKLSCQGEKTKTTVSILNAQIVSFSQETYKDEREGKKLGYFFGIVPTNAEPFVFEAFSIKERYGWVEALQENGGLDGGLIKMKIDKYQISNEGTESKEVHKKGTLAMRGALAKKWKTSEFTLTGEDLSYQNDSLNKFSVLGANVKVYANLVWEEEGREGFLFGILPANQQFELLLETETEQDRDEWVAALQKNGAIFKGLVKAKRANPASIKEGFLSKRGGNVKTWKERYFVLLSRRIQYFRNRFDEHPAGEIIFSQSMKVELDPSREFGITIMTGVGCRQYYITASNEEDCNSWVKAISSALSDGK